MRLYCVIVRFMDEAFGNKTAMTGSGVSGSCRTSLTENIMTTAGRHERAEEVEWRTIRSILYVLEVTLGSKVEGRRPRQIFDEYNRYASLRRQIASCRGV